MLANPDFVARLKTDAPMNTADRGTFFGGTAKGYTDYPALCAAPAVEGERGQVHAGVASRKNLYVVIPGRLRLHRRRIRNPRCRPAKIKMDSGVRTFELSPTPFSR